MAITLARHGYFIEITLGGHSISDGKTLIPRASQASRQKDKDLVFL